MSFTNAVVNREARTDNGMKARASTADACTDLFFQIGGSRGKNIIPAFVAAFASNPELAIRIALWARDVRGGAGERKLFRDILTYLSNNDTDSACRVLNKVSELGRWDDVFAAEGDARQYGFMLVAKALASHDALAAKWMPRKGPLAAELRSWLGVTPKQYRKFLVALTNVVESRMCAKDWDNINYSQVPSLALARYKKAFSRHSQKFAEWAQKLVDKSDPTVKVNAGAVYPYDVLKGLAARCQNSYSETEFYDEAEKNALIAQWEALPNYVGDASILPIIDTSGSMTWTKLTASGLMPLDVAVSLGLYMADKNRGPFNGTFMTFSERPDLVHLQGDIVQKVQQMVHSDVGGSTNLHAAFDKVLEVAVMGNVSQADMPKMLLIFSDMQFNCCFDYDDSAIEMIRRKYEAAGYEVPKVVFWCLEAHGDNAPVKFNEQGVALVSGFSPAVVKPILSADPDSFDPFNIMLEAVGIERYDF